MSPETNYQVSLSSARTAVSFRPPCFIKPGMSSTPDSATGALASSSSTTSTSDSSSSIDNHISSTSSDGNQPDEMRAFIKTFDNYCQKVYIEGYLYKYNGDQQRTRCYAELSGPTLSVWDAQVQSPRILPQYFNISDVSVERQVVDGRLVIAVHMSHGSKTQRFELPDEATLGRWVCAMRLSCFESKKLHMLFTVRLLLPTLDSDTAEDYTNPIRWESTLQVRMDAKDWHKYWVIVNSSSGVRRKSLFGRKASTTPGNNGGVAALKLLETKKSKNAVATMTQVTHAYAIYPEKPQLLDNKQLGLMVRVEGTIECNGKCQEGHVLLMTDSRQQLCTILMAIFDAFHLYGRPGALLSDITDPLSLDYGCTASPRLFLEPEDLVLAMDPGPLSPRDIERICLAAIHHNMSQPIRGGARANSLPLITVACDDDKDHDDDNDDCHSAFIPSFRQRSASDSRESPQDIARFSREPQQLFPRQIMDSSDEEDASEESSDEEDDDNEESDSDDEPIGKTSAASTSAAISGTTSRGSQGHPLVPDFDFGNGFDVSTSPRLLAQPSSPQQQQKGEGKSGETSAVQQSNSNKESGLFDDFSLSMDFAKYMTTSSSSDTPRKHSLPSTYLLSGRESVDHLSSSGAGSSASSFLAPLSSQRRRSWDPQGSQDAPGRWYDDNDEEYHKSQHPYDCDEYGGGYDYGYSEGEYDEEGPMIPSLSDHFATQNSLLDTYLGEQLTAKEQIQYCRATGQPFIQIDENKTQVPEGGFVGIISRREKDRKQGNNTRVSGRVQQHHIDIEKERRLMEQRQQQWMKHQVNLKCLLM